jgi:hypothetical protein
MDNNTVTIPLSESAHKVGCPAERVESYEAQKPESQGSKIVTVVRCADCGGHEVHDGGMARVARKFTEPNEGKADGRRTASKEPAQHVNAG